MTSAHHTYGEIQAYVSNLTAEEKKLLVGLHTQGDIILENYLWDALARQNSILTSGVLTEKGRRAAQMILNSTPQRPSPLTRFLVWVECSLRRSKFDTGI